MKVQQFYNKNQFVITGNGDTVFQSYDSTIAKIDKNGQLSFGGDWDYSQTTRKHLYLFLSDYKSLIANFQYAEIFHHNGGLFNASNKSAFLRRLIDRKTIKVCL